MPLYEHVFLARQDVSTQQVEGLQETFRSLIEENGGSVAKTEYWGGKEAVRATGALVFTPPPGEAPGAGAVEAIPQPPRHWPRRSRVTRAATSAWPGTWPGSGTAPRRSSPYTVKQNLQAISYLKA